MKWIISWEGYQGKGTIQGPHPPEAHNLWPLIVKSEYYRNMKSPKRLESVEATQHFLPRTPVFLIFQ